jgi:hypothetical protein
MNFIRKKRGRVALGWVPSARVTLHLAADSLESLISELLYKFALVSGL